MASQDGGDAARNFEEQWADILEEDDDITKGQDDVHCSKGFLARPISLLRTLFTTIIPDFMWSILNLWLLIFASFVSMLICFYSVLVNGDTSYLYYDGYTPDSSEEDNTKKKGSSIKMRKVAIKIRIHRLTVVTAVRTGFLVLVWMVINLRVPSLRRVRVLGSLLWKWSLLASLILLAHTTLMCLLDRTSTLITEAFFKNKRKRENVYHYTRAIAKGLILPLYFTSLLLAWLICVDTTIDQLHRYGTLTLVSLLVGGVLSLLKKWVLLWWRTTLIYNKYKLKILSAACYLYFNLLLMDQQYSDSNWLVDWFNRDEYTRKVFVPVDPKAKEMEDHKGRPNRHKILPIEEYMLKQGVSIENVHTVATQLTYNFELSLTEDDDIPDIAPYLRGKLLKGGHRPGSARLEYNELYSSMESVDANLLIELLQLETSKEYPTYADSEKWMVDGLKYSYAVGYRIDGAFQVMRILSRVMTASIIVVVILVWLFITGLASTKVVVGLASIFLGLSFVFGDACKTFFQGVIFSFVTHPFDVADRCIIDDKELKVKKINILTTTFFGSQSKEIVLYPNSDLATKRIVLLHGERESDSKPERKAEGKAAADLSDLVEFNLPPKTTSLQIKSLRDTIERHLDGGLESGVYKNSYWVSLMEFGDSIKMRVNFEHVLPSDGDNSEHSKSIEMRKQIQRSNLVLQLKEFVEDMGNDVSLS